MYKTVMDFIKKAHPASWLALGLALSLPWSGLSPTDSYAADLRIDIAEKIEVSSGLPVYIPVYMDNYSDTVAGFTILFQLDRPDVVTFRTEVDTSSSLISGWELLVATNLGESGYNVKVTALANLPAEPLTAGIGPQIGGLLFYLVADVVIPPSSPDSSALIFINENLWLTSFSDELGALISVVPDTVITEECWSCQLWMGDPAVCLDWMLVSTPPCDSTALDTVIIPRLDLFDGSIAIVSSFGCCLLAGDANGNSSTNIADAIFIINRVFDGGPDPACCEEADANGNGSVNIADAIFIIISVFSGGGPPSCGPAGMSCAG